MMWLMWVIFLCQVYLISFAAQWNSRMEAQKISGDSRRHLNRCTDPRQVQRMNHQAKELFGSEHLFEPNFVAPMPYPENYTDTEEEELLGVEYAYCQSTASFNSRQYYMTKGEN